MCRTPSAILRGRSSPPATRPTEAVLRSAPVPARMSPGVDHMPPAAPASPSPPVQRPRAHPARISCSPWPPAGGLRGFRRRCAAFPGTSTRRSRTRSIGAFSTRSMIIPRRRSRCCCRPTVSRGRSRGSGHGPAPLRGIAGLAHLRGSGSQAETHDPDTCWPRSRECYLAASCRVRRYLGPDRPRRPGFVGQLLVHPQANSRVMEPMRNISRRTSPPLRRERCMRAPWRDHLPWSITPTLYGPRRFLRRGWRQAPCAIDVDAEHRAGQ